MAASRQVKIGTLVDRLYSAKEKLNQQRAVMAKEEAKLIRMRAKYDAMEAQLLHRLPQDQLTGGQGKLARGDIDISNYPTIKDYNKFCQYVQKTKNYNLFQRRVNSLAYREITGDGKKRIPGLENFKKTTIKLKGL